MTRVNGVQFQLQRINPVQGLMIDANVWRDAHEYHRDQVRLHHLALHGWGIVQGLDVSLEGSDNTLVIQPGLGIDPAGNFVIVGQTNTFRLETQSPGPIYLVVQFREVLAGSPQSGIEGAGPPTRILEAYRIQQRDRLPSEPFLELARVQYDPTRGPITMPSDPENPGPNELDTRFRARVAATDASSAAPLLPSTALPADASPQPSAPMPPSVFSASDGPVAPRRVASPGVLTLALAAHEGAGWDHHRAGLQYLAREVQATAGLSVRTFESLELALADQADLLYVAGGAPLGLGDTEVAGVARLLEQGGLVIGEGCATGPKGEAGAREFALSFIDLAGRLGRRLAEVTRGHPLLVARHVFAELPAGCRAQARLVESGGMVYSDADYGCAWQGGAADRPLPRAAIRDALEFGVNLVLSHRSGR